jgi:hypothetical protein
MKRLLLAALAVSLPLHADTLADLKAAVGGLRGSQPIRAGAELHKSEKEEGRFSDGPFSGGVSLEVALGVDGAHLTFAPAVIEQFAREQREHSLNPKKPAALSRTAERLGPLWVLEHLNAADTFLGLLRYAKLQSETRAAAAGGRPARLLVFKVDSPTRDMKGLGGLEMKEHTLRVWVGEDNLPIAAEEVQDGTVRVLLFHGSIKLRDSWTFGRSGDHLVMLRHDSTHSGDLFGQKSDGSGTEIVTVR